MSTTMTNHYNYSEILHPPPISLLKKEKDPGSNKKDKNTIVTVHAEPNDPESSTMDKKVKIFTDGDGEDFVRWAISFAEIQHAKPLETGESRFNMAGLLLQGNAKDHYDSFVAMENNTLVQNFNTVLNKMVKHYLSMNAVRDQKSYLCYGLHLKADFFAFGQIFLFARCKNFLLFLPKKKKNSK